MKILKESVNDIQVYMNTWANYNENGADLSRYGIESISDGWMSIDEAREFAEKYAEDEPFINDIDNYSGISLGINEYSNVEESLDLLERINNLSDRELEELDAIIDARGDNLNDALDVLESGDYWYIPGVDDQSDLAYEVIASIGSIKDAVNNPEYYIDEDALKRDLSYDVREMMRDEAEDYVKEQHRYDDEDEYDFDQEVEDYIDDNEDSYLDSLVDEILYDPDDNTIENYFDYDQFGRDLTFDGWTLTKNGAIRID